MNVIAAAMFHEAAPPSSYNFRFCLTWVTVRDED
jgi:hypothetical protein